jgi:hypothetical protein
VDIPHEEQFHFNDGTSVASLEQLKEKIESISYDEFYGHVNEEKNDFASWVEGVLQQKELASKLQAVGSIVETVELLNEALYPEEVQQAEQKLKEEGVEDFQERIEEQLFAEAPEPEPVMEEPVMEEPVMENAEMETPLSKPPEMEGQPIPGEPVTTTEPAHTPITEMVSKPATTPHHFPVVQFLLGIVFGIVVGALLVLALLNLKGGF